MHSFLWSLRGKFESSVLLAVSEAGGGVEAGARGGFVDRC